MLARRRRHYSRTVRDNRLIQCSTHEPPGGAAPSLLPMWAALGCMNLSRPQRSVRTADAPATIGSHGTRAVLKNIGEYSDRGGTGRRGRCHRGLGCGTRRALMTRMGVIMAYSGRAFYAIRVSPDPVAPVRLGLPWQRARKAYCGAGVREDPRGSGTWLERSWSRGIAGPVTVPESRLVEPAISRRNRATIRARAKPGQRGAMWSSLMRRNA